MRDPGRPGRERRRGDCYRLLSACFHPPDCERLLQDRTCLELAETLDDLYPDGGAASHAAALQCALADTTALALRVDHAALFVGPFRLEAPPYGSVYLEEARTLMGDTTLAAAACYAAAGLALTLHEPPDHVAVELEFMHYLIVRTAQAAERGDRDGAARLADQQHDFLHVHVGAWGPAFCAAIARGAGTAFYRALGDCLGAFLDAELRHSAVVEAPAAL